MKRLLIVAGLASSLLAWIGYALLSRPLAAWMAHQWGAQLLHAGDGKFTDAAVFLQNRFREGAWLVTWLAVLLVATVWLGTVLQRRLPALWRWIPHSVAGFVALNLWVRLAMGTCLFWCLLWSGKGTTDNLTQFHIKRLLMDENPASVKAVLGGSSQVRAEIDDRLLNQALAPRVFATELHFPGNKGFDFLFLERALRRQEADVIVCYLSEGNFFGEGLSAGFALFFSWGDLADFLRLGGRPGWGAKGIGYGMLGDMLPLFRLRDALAQRLLGAETANIKQRQRDEALASNLEQRAADAAANYRAGPQTAFEMGAFEQFVARCQARRIAVVLCCGQLNPILSSKLDPALRPRMVSFLQQLAARHGNVTLVEPGALPVHSAEDYEDLTHVNRAAQERFTEAIVRVLAGLARQRAGERAPLDEND